METKELLQIVKLIKNTWVVAHAMGGPFGTKSYELKCVKDTVIARHMGGKATSEYENLGFLNKNIAVEWQVKIQTKYLLRLVKRKSVERVDASIVANGLRASHELYMDGDKLYDTGIDGEGRSVTPARFLKDYPNVWWTINEVLTEEGQLA